jgi:hypothetical protein
MFVGEQGSLPLQLGTLIRFTREFLLTNALAYFVPRVKKTGLTTLTEEQHE